MEFGERTRDCSLGHAGNEGHHLAMMGNLMVFLELWRQCGVSHEVRWGAQGASRVGPGKSGLHVSGEGDPIIALDSC